MSQGPNVSELAQAQEERDARRAEIARCERGGALEHTLLADVDRQSYVRGIRAFEALLARAPKFEARDRDDVTDFLITALTPEQTRALTIYGVIKTTRGSELAAGEHGTRFLRNMVREAPNEFTHLGVDTLVYEKLFLTEATA